MFFAFLKIINKLDLCLQPPHRAANGYHGGDKLRDACHSLYQALETKVIVLYQAHETKVFTGIKVVFNCNVAKFCHLKSQSQKGHNVTTKVRR